MKTALIVALILLVIGILLAGAGWILLQKFPIERNTLKDTVYPFTGEDLPNTIQITTLDSRVEILPIDGEEWRVECKETENNPHTVELVDGVLTVRQNGDERKWYEYIGILKSFQNPSVLLYLPKQAYESLSIHSVSGSIKVQEGFIFSNASLQNTSGSILCNSRIAGALNVQNTSGSVKINGSVGGDLTVKNTSGSIDVFGGVNGVLKVTNGSGSIDIKNATPTCATVKSISGSIDLIDVVCGELCEIENGSGSIELQECDAASFDLKTVSGSIKGSILSGKVFDCHSTSGGVHVPENSDGGTFKARTTSAGIRITVVE